MLCTAATTLPAGVSAIAARRRRRGGGGGGGGGGTGLLPRARASAASSRSRCPRRVTAAAAAPHRDSASSSSSVAVDAASLEALLPPGYVHNAATNRIADVSAGTASFGVAMPNLRPLKEAKNEWLFSMKFGSVLLLGGAVAGILAHNVQLAMQKKEAGIDATADSIDLGYGFGYGYDYGYSYGYAYGHVYGDEELTLGRGRAMMMGVYEAGNGMLITNE